MGWCSATYIFDAAIEAAYKLQNETLKTANCERAEFPNPALVEFAKAMRDELENGLVPYHEIGFNRGGRVVKQRCPGVGKRPN